MHFTISSQINSAVLLLSAWNMVGAIAKSHTQFNSPSRRQDAGDYDNTTLGGCEGACAVFNGTFNNPECMSEDCRCTGASLVGLGDCVKCVEENSPSPEFIVELKDFAQSYEAELCSPEDLSSASALSSSRGAPTASTTTSSASITSTSTTLSTGTGASAAQTTA
ncbi:hypothetical protein FA13DRAFT_1818301, partial [Coprinellus micaceus]